MKKARKIFSLACAFIMTGLVSLFTACAKETTVYLTVKSDDNKPAWFVYVIIAVAIVAAALVILKLLAGKKTKEEEPEDTVVLTQDPNAVSEYLFEDEIRAARKAAEENAEEKSEETATDEQNEEKSEETATDEQTEEKSTETIEEISNETVEEKKEETYDDVVEDVANASFTSSDNDKADVTVEETDALTYMFDENGLPVAPEGMVVRYKWSFLARLIQADDELKYRYMILRRKLLSYKKVRSNVSWNFDSYFVGRTPIVKLKVRGKTLVAYFPIDPKEMEGTKYVGEDFSGISRYKAVPFAYRINGMRKLKYAIELIEKQLDGVKSTEPVYIEKSQVNEAIPRESLKKLYAKGYVRVGGILAVGERASAKDDEDDDMIEVIETEFDDEAAPSEFKEEFNFNPKLQ